MAETFAKKLGDGIVEPYSAGSKPSGTVNPDAVYVMREAGIDISGQSSKGFDDLPPVNFDIAATLGCGDTCPTLP